MNQNIAVLLAFIAGMATTTIIGWRTTLKEKASNPVHHEVVAKWDSHPVIL